MLKDVNDIIKEIKLAVIKKTVAEKIDRISNLKDRIKEMSETKKKWGYNFKDY